MPTLWTRTLAPRIFNAGHTRPTSTTTAYLTRIEARLATATVAGRATVRGWIRLIMAAVVAETFDDRVQLIGRASAR